MYDFEERSPRKLNGLNNPYTLFCLLISLLLCVCTEIPENCGNYILRDPFTGQCKESTNPNTTIMYEVTVTSAGIGAIGGGYYTAGTRVIISAGTPPAGQVFKNWTASDVTIADPNTVATSFVMPSYAVTVTAVFEAASVTPPDVSYGTLTDSRDGKTYKTVKIGSQTWMAENLNYATKAGEGNSWCYSDNNSNCETYGRLYDWSTAMAGSPSSERNPSGVRGVCPANWHLPSRGEWDALVTAAGDSSVAGKALKSKTGWYSYSRITNEDTYGFSALPGGRRYSAGTFNDAGYVGIWWTATEGSGEDAYRRNMTYSYDSVGGRNDFKSDGFAVRCLAD